jgi:myosin-3
VLETIKIRKLGYAFRMPFGEFVRKFKNIVYHYHEMPAETAEVCNKILSEMKLDNFQIGSTKVFMKYYHSDVLMAHAKQHAQALLFLQNIVKGHVTRELYQGKLVEARMTRFEVVNFFQSCETQGAKVAARSRLLVGVDAKEKDSRNWMDRVAQQAENSEATALELEEMRKDALAKVEDEPKEIKTEMVNGYFMWQQNDHLDLKVGVLERPWRKKLDETTGRYYFKNTETKKTTWVDPRTFEFRAHDPAATKGDELPFGWDKAETQEGVVFYVNHLLNEHHKDHPRDQLNHKKAKYAKLSSNVEDAEAPVLKNINELKEKRTLLTVQLGEATDEQARAQVQKRIDDLSRTISLHTDTLRKSRSKLEALKSQIERMSSRKSIDSIIPM